MRRCVVLFALLPLAIGCGRKQETSTSSAAKDVRPAAAPASTSEPEEDLAAFASGALVVQEPEPDSQHSASWLLRGRYLTEWNWEVAGAANPTVVIEFAERSLVKHVEFDTAMVTAGSAKDVAIEISDTSAKEGFTRIADAVLQERTDNQVFLVSANARGRWVRLTVKSAYGSNSAGINRFRARGTRLAHTPFPNVTGVYATRNGTMHIRQDGTSVAGCYEHQQGILAGGIEGRVMKLTWREKAVENNEGEAIMVFSSDAQRWAGLFSYKGEDLNNGRFWTGTRRAGTAGGCPHWAGGIEQQMAKDIEEFGRARVYGINFDSDSDVIRDESRPTLDHVAAMLKAREKWNITIEGHTDSTATAQHNQDLSERRAVSVRRYLENAGIAAARLNAVGYGSARPVSGNDTSLGRAQNRRVELVKR